MSTQEDLTSHFWDSLKVYPYLQTSQSSQACYGIQWVIFPFPTILLSWNIAFTPSCPAHHDNHLSWDIQELSLSSPELLFHVLNRFTPDGPQDWSQWLLNSVL